MKTNPEEYFPYHGKHILLIEDDLDDQFIFRDVLKELSAGLTCSVADNGHSGLLMMNTEPFPDVVFVDLNLPVMNGFEYLIAAKKRSGDRTPPIIILTTSTSEIDMAMAKQSGAEGFISKPHTFDTFRDVLHRTLMYIFADQPK